MGCFLGCFRVFKRIKNRHQNGHIANITEDVEKQQQDKDSPIHQNGVSKQELSEECINVQVIESRLKKEGQLNSGAQKRVTFDSNVKDHEHVSFYKAPKILEEHEEEISANSTKPEKFSSSSESGSTPSSLVSFPQNPRYQNFRESDDEVDKSDLDEDENENEPDDGDEDDDGGGGCGHNNGESRQVPEISSASCFSTESTTSAANDKHVDKPTKYIASDKETNTPSSQKETNTPPVFYRGARDRSCYVHSVLNPVENTTQWKNVKGKPTLSMKHQKENSQMDLSFNQSSLKCKTKLDYSENTHEVAVDASLSTWLDSSRKTPLSKPTLVNFEPISSVTRLSTHGSDSMRHQEERSILGILTSEKLKQFSATSSPTNSPNRNRNEKPLVGDVGIHGNNRNDWTDIEDFWSSPSSFKGIPNTSSKYREDKRVSWHSTPFVTSLERALNRGALTIEELKQYPATSPRKSPNRTPNEEALVGDVEIHGNNRNDKSLVEDSSMSSSSFRGIPNTISKYREDKRVTLHSTPFETRLERALNRGALMIKQLKQYPATSPRMSPNQIPDEEALLGVVGIDGNSINYDTLVEDFSNSSSSFKGIPNTISKYREDKRVTWHSTPFETRLERALNRGATDSST